MCEDYHYPHLHVGQLGVTVFERHEQAVNFLAPAMNVLRDDPAIDRHILTKYDIFIVSELFSRIEATFECIKTDWTIDHTSEVSYTVANFGEGFKVTQILELTIHEERLVSMLVDPNS